MKKRYIVVLAGAAAYLCAAFWLKPWLDARNPGAFAQLPGYSTRVFHKHPDHPIDLNRATATELQELPGIGPSTAAQIIRFREQSGPFRQPEDLLAIPRFSRHELERIRPYVVVTQAQ